MYPKIKTQNEAQEITQLSIFLPKTPPPITKPL